MSTLKQQVHDKSWEVDWAAYEQHETLAGKHLAANDLPAAFRESCRAMRMLTEQLNRHRHKEEVFKPVWDKKQW